MLYFSAPLRLASCLTKSTRQSNIRDGLACRRLTFARGCRQPAAAAMQPPASLREASPGIINLAVGHPADSLLPRSVLAAAAAAASASVAAPGSDISYGRSAGPAPFCEALAQFLRLEHASAIPAVASELFVTNGASHALDLALGCLVSPGDTVLVERPTYFLAGGVLADHRVAVEELAGTSSGICVDSLERRLRDPSKPKPRALYLVPTHGNPSGATLPPAARERIVRLAGEHGFFVLADEVYQLLDWTPPGGGAAAGTPGGGAGEGDGKEGDLAALRAWPKPGGGPPERLRAFDRALARGREFAAASLEDDPLGAARPGSRGTRLKAVPGATVVSLNAFTKILSPGLRLGWIEAAPPILQAIASRGYIVSGGGVAPFTSEIVRHVLTSGAQSDYLRKLRREYSSRCDTLCRALAEHAERTGWTFQCPMGGYFLWLRMPDGLTGKEVAAAAEKSGVKVLDGARCTIAAENQAGPALPPLGLEVDAPSWYSDVTRHVRCCFAYLDEGEIRTGVERLADVVAELRQERQRPAAAAASGALRS